MNNENSTPSGSLPENFENEARYKEVDNEMLDLIREAKARPLPKSTKTLVVITVFALIFTGGAYFGKMKANPSTSTGLSLAGIGGPNALGGAAAGAGGRTRGGGGGGGGGGGAGVTGQRGVTEVAPEVVINLPDDVVGTVISISAKEIVIETLTGERQTFPITTTTKVRESNKISLPSLKTGDIVTIKPETDKSAKTVTVVK